MRKMILSLLLAFTLAVPFAGAAHGGEALPSSLELTRLMGNGINLGNTFEACNNGMSGGNTTDVTSYYETMWGQPVTTRKMIRGMKEAGFDTLRVPVAWMTNATHLGKGGMDYTISAAYMDRVAEVVSWALDEGMFVILNDHWDGGWWGMFGSEAPETRALAMEAYRGMWAQIAARFASCDWHLIFESANEELGSRFDENSPIYCQDSITSYLPDNERYALTNQVNQAFVDVVRAAGGNNADRFLLIAGYGTNIAQTFDARFVMPSDPAADRLLISVHCYTPWSYCGASSAGTATKWGTKANYDELENELKMMSKFTGRKIGVVIGEYGALPGADGVLKENSVAYHRAFLDMCDYYDYCPVLWDCSGQYLRTGLKMRDGDMAALYLEKRQSTEGSIDEVKAAARASLDAAREAAPETFRTDAIELTDDTCVAWIMWNAGDWSVSYSVGDTYSPDTISAGLVPTDAVVTGQGTYTIGLDFTGTAGGYSNSTAFAAIGLSNGEALFPGYVIDIQSITVNGEEFKTKGRAYTTSDDGKCTRVNLYNEWVTKVPETGRTRGGGTIGCTPTLLDKAALGKVETITVTFRFVPGALGVSENDANR
ncbi:MAG: glycoside hydrolase family 5 protein [Clostridia bacterium]|nr:glycoside hydrolase family 5 protein [Clostridia bacterium]